MTMPLTIAERLFLLAHKNETGEKQGSFTEHAFAGAAIADLMIMGRLQADQKKPKRITLADSTPTGNPFLDTVLQVVSKKGSGKNATDYVLHLAGKKSVLDALADGLVSKGIVERDEKSFLFFKWSHFPEANPRVEADLTHHLSRVMFEGETPHPEDCVTIAIAEKIGVLKRNFDPAQLKEHKARIKAIAKGETALSRPATEAIATVIAVIAATVAASTAAASAG